MRIAMDVSGNGQSALLSIPRDLYNRLDKKAVHFGVPAAELVSAVLDLGIEALEQLAIIDEFRFALWMKGVRQDFNRDLHLILNMERRR